MTRQLCPRTEFLRGIAVAALDIAAMGKPALAADIIGMEDLTLDEFEDVGLTPDEFAQLKQIMETPYD